jgi:hypothetical protein
VKLEISEEWFKRKIEELGDIDDAITIGPLHVDNLLSPSYAFFERLDAKAKALLEEQERQKKLKQEINILIPIIRNIMPRIIAEQICSVQPMSGDIYDPLLINEDYIFPCPGAGKGSEVETLSGGELLGEITDINYFGEKVVINDLKLLYDYKTKS